MPYGALTGNLFQMASGNRIKENEQGVQLPDLKVSTNPSGSTEKESQPAGTIDFSRSTPSESQNGRNLQLGNGSTGTQEEGGVQQPLSDMDTAMASVSNQFALWFGDRYAFTPREQDTFRTMVEGSSDPVDTAGRYIASVALSKRLGTTADRVYPQLDMISKYFTGETYRAGDATLAEKVNASFESIEIYDLKGEWMRIVQRNGVDDPAAKKLEAEIQQREAAIGGIQNAIPKGFWDSIASAAIGSLGYTAEGIKYGAAASVAAMAATTPMVASLSAVNLAAGAAAGATAGLWAGFAGAVAGFQRTGDLTEYDTFWDLMHLTDVEGNLLPQDVDTALLIAGINGNITGFIETMADGIISRGVSAFSPAVTKRFGIPNLAVKVLTDRGVSGVRSRLAYAGVDWLMGGLNEGFIQEATEQLATSVLTAAYQKNVGAVPDISLKKLASNFFRTGFESTLVGLVYGGVGIPSTMRKYNQLSFDLRRTANVTPSEEVYREIVKDKKPDDVPQADWDKAVGDIHAAQKAQMEAIFGKTDGTVMASMDLATEELYDTVDVETGEETGVVPDGSVYRDPETEELFTVTEEANGRKRVYVGDPNSKAVYGYAEVDTDGDTLTVGSVRVRLGYEGIRAELVQKAISEQRTGESTIAWEPTTEGLQNVKELLIQNNPRGREAGLDYGADFSVAQDHDIQQIAAEISTAFPKLTKAQSVVAARIYSIADRTGNLSKLNGGQPVRKSDTLASRYRGAADAARAIIYAGQNADFSTLYHELFHVNAANRPAEARELSNAIRSSMQDEASKANLRKFIEESSPIWGEGADIDHIMSNLASIAADADASQWSREQFENLARLAEAYATADNSKRTTLPEAIRNIIRKIAEFMRQVYQTVVHTVPLPKEITDAYEAIMYKSRVSERNADTSSGIQHQSQHIIRMPIKENTYESVIELATEAHPQFVRDIEDIRQLVGADESDVSIRPTLKSRKRSDEKVFGDYSGDYGQNLDYDGAMIKFDNLTDAETAWNKVKKSYGDRIVKDKHLITPLGYEDYKVNIRMDNGFIAEIQFLDRDYFFIKEAIGHDLYEISRTIAEFKKQGIDGFNALQEAIDAWSTEEYGLAKIYANDREAYERSEARRNAVSLSIRQALSSALSRYQISSESVSSLSTISLPSSEGISLDTGEIVVASILNGISLISTYLKDSGIMPSTQSIDSQGNGGNLVYQSAYHGSPHSFDRFSTDHIGEGAGSQSFGWGIYITSDRKIAEGYAELGISKEDKASDIEYFQKTLEAARKRFGEAKERLEANPQDQILQHEYDTALRQLNDEEDDMRNLLNSPAEGRNLYTVDIPDTGYIKWDSEVPVSLSRRIAEALEADEYDTDDIMQYYRTTGAEMYSYLSKQLDGDKNASLFLRNLGVVGIDYPAGTRMGLPDGANAGARNYVIFSGDDIALQDHLVYQDAKAPDTSDLTDEQKEKRTKAEEDDIRYTDGDNTELDDFYDDFDSSMDGVVDSYDAEEIARIYSEWAVEADAEAAANPNAAFIDEDVAPYYDENSVNLMPDGSIAASDAEYERAMNEETIPSLMKEDDISVNTDDTGEDTAGSAVESELIYPGISYRDAYDEELSWNDFVDRNKPDIVYKGTEAEKDDQFIKAIHDDDTLLRYLGIIGEALYLNTRELNENWHFSDQIQRERVKSRVFDVITNTSVRNASLTAMKAGEGRTLSSRMYSLVRREMTDNARFYRNILSWMMADEAMKPESLMKEVRGLDIPSRDILDAMPIEELRALAVTAEDRDVVDQIERGTLRMNGGADETMAAEINAALESLAKQITEQRDELSRNEDTISTLEASLDSISSALKDRDRHIDNLVSTLQKVESIIRNGSKELSGESLEAYSFTPAMKKISAELSWLNKGRYESIEAEHTKGKHGKYEIPKAKRAAKEEYIDTLTSYYPDLFEKDGRKFGKLDGIRDIYSPSGFEAVQEILKARREALRADWKKSAATYVDNLATSVWSASRSLSENIDGAVERINRLEKEIERQKKLKATVRNNRDRQVFDARTEERWKAAKMALDAEKEHNQEIQNWKSYADWQKRRNRKQIQTIMRKAKDDAALLADWMKAKADVRISELKAEQREKRRQERLYNRIREEKEKLARAICRPVNLNTTDYSVAEPIMAIQALIDPEFRREWVPDLEKNPEGISGGGTMSFEDAVAYFSGLSEDERIRLESVISPALLARLTGQRNPLNDWSIDELRRFADDVSALRKRGREILSAKKAFERETREKIQKAIIDAVKEAAKRSGRDSADTLPGTAERVKQSQGILAKWRSAKYITMRMQELAQLLDGGLGYKGAAYSLLVDEKRYHQSREWKAVDARMAKVAPFLTKEAINNLFEQVTVQLDDDFHHAFTVNELAYIYLSQFDEDSKAAVAYGNLLTETEKGTLRNKGRLDENGRFIPETMSAGTIVNDDELKAIGDRRYHEVVRVSTLELENRGLMPLVKAIREDFADSENFRRLNSASIEAYNTPIKRVLNYLPIMRTDLRGDSFRNDMADALFNLNTGDFNAALDKGMTISRINIAPRHQRGVNLSLLEVWQKSVRNQEHLIEFAGYAKKLRGVFGNNAAELIATIDKVYSPGLMKEVQGYINYVIDPYSGKPRTNLDKTLKNLRGRTGAAYLGWKLPGVVLQFCTSAWPFLQDMSPAALLKGYMKIAAGRGDVLNMIYEKSPMMKHRTMNTVVQEALERRGDATRSKAGRTIDRFNEIGQLGLTWVDKTLVAGGWLGAYETALQQNLDAGMDTALADAAAIKTADDVVLRTQPAGDSTELPSMFRNSNELVKIFLQFQSSLSVIWNNMIWDNIGFARNRQYGKIISTIVSYGMAGLVLGLVADGFDDDDDTADKARKLGYWFMTQGIESFPVFGSDISLVLQRAMTGERDFYGNGVDMFPGLTKIFSGIEDIVASDKPFLEGVWKISEGAGIFVGAPVSGLKNLKRVAAEGPAALLGR